MSLKLSTSVAESYAFISRYDDAINLGPEPDLGPAPERADGESDESFKARADAWAAPLRAWERPLNVARETGDYGPVTLPGVRPLLFKLRAGCAVDRSVGEFGVELQRCQPVAFGFLALGCEGGDFST